MRWVAYDELGSLFSNRSVIHRKSDSTVPFADGAYGGDLLRDNPQPIHEHLPRSLRGEDPPSIMEDNGRLAKTGPGMLSSSDANQVIFPF